MAGQQVADGVDSGNRACLKSSGAEMLLHEAANRFPFGGADAAPEASVSNDFDIAVRQLDVDQDPVVVLGIPHTQVRVHLERTRAR